MADLETDNSNMGQDSHSAPRMGQLVSGVSYNPGSLAPDGSNHGVTDPNVFYRANTITSGTQWGINPYIGPNGSDTNKNSNDANALKKSKADAKNKGQDTDNPTAASSDKSMQIHDAIMSADPNALNAVLKKAVQSIVMLKMMDKLTSPAGLAGMAAGAIGGALQQLAGQVGVGPLLGALNNVMPALSMSGLLPPSMMSALHEGMMGMLTGSAVGVLTPSSVAAAASTASTIASTVATINSGNPSAAVAAVATLGGASFGLAPGSLASQIAILSPSMSFRTSIGGVSVGIISSPVASLASSIPSLGGSEHIAIASGAVTGIASGLGVALGIGAAASAIGNIAGLTPGGLAGILNNGISGIESAGLQAVLGVGTSGLLGAASKLLPSVGGQLNTALGNLTRTPLNPGTIGALATNAAKAMALSRVSMNIAKSIFQKSEAEQAQEAAHNLAAFVAKTGQAASLTLPNGTTITCRPG
jgi:hypothetical protein